jgi:4-hydroxy-2-oxoheptanedioate aldolase
MKGAGSWEARRNPLKEAMQRGGPAIAMWTTSPWAAVPEILGVAGIDGVLLDLEHVSHGVSELELLITAADAAGISAIVRPPDTEPSLVSRILDAGAHGIVFPRVEDAAGAELAVRCTRYPPRGQRGWGGAHTRYAKWQGGYARDRFNGTSTDPGVYTSEYVARADEGSLVVLLIESVRGVANAQAICAVEGVDAVIFGWGDYAVEVGFDRDRAREAAEVVAAAARAAGVGLGVSPGDPCYPGCFTIAGIDTLLMSAALSDAVTAARAAADGALAEQAP